MVNENDWLTDFVITQDDLHRLEEWLGEQNRGVTLEELTRRIIRGRLRFGRDEGKELSWVYESGRVLRRDDSAGFVIVDAELPHSLATRLQKHRTLPDVSPQ